MAIQLSDHFTYKKLLRFSLPSILMMVFTSVYGVVDGYFVSNFAGKTPFAGINFIMPFLMILSGMGFMIGTGGCALIGKTLGEGDKEKANRIFSLMIYFTVLLSVLLAVIGYFTVRPLSVLLGADEEMLGYCVSYSNIIFLGLPAAMLQFEFHSFFVVAEKPKLGLFFTVISGITNMIADAVLVGVLRLGVQGAAAATVASQIIGGFAPLIYFSCKNSSLLRLGRAELKIKILLKALGNGSSEFVSNISMSVVNMLYNVQLMKYSGENGVAAFGVLMYVNLIFIAVFIGYSVGTAPVISFNYGAQNHSELKNLFGKSLKIIGLFAVMMLLAGELCARPLAVLFVGYDKELTDLTVRAFYIFSFTFLFASVPIYGSSFFTALNDGFTSAAISFLRTIVFQSSAILLFPLIFGIDGIWLSIVAAEAVATVVTSVFWITKRKKYNY